MKRLNQKGFTLIEIIAAVTLLGILTVIALSAFVTYLDWSRKKSYDTMAKSASTAAEQYIMDFPHASVPEDEAITEEGYQSGITYEELSEAGYLSDITDPMGGECTGKVVIGYIKAEEDNKRALDKYMFVVHECCSNYEARYIYSYELKLYEEKDKNGNKVQVQRLEPVEKVSKKDVICEKETLPE